MKKITNIFLILFSIILFQNCEEDQFESSLNYVSFSSAVYSTGVDIGGTTNFDVKVYASSITGADRSFSVTADDSDAAAGSYTVPASVTIPSGSNEGILTVALSDVNLGIGVNRLVLNFSDVLVGHASGSSTTIEYIQNCDEVTATLAFTFDPWPEEIGWTITDALGGVVASAATGTYAGNPSGGTSSESITLCSGRDYTLNITDGYGDGAGPYSLTIGGVVKANGNGDYEGGESMAFDTN